MKLSVLVLLVVTAICVDQTLSVLPGFQVRLTQKGLDYANSVAQRYLSKVLNGISIPDYAGNFGYIHYKLSGIKNKRVKIPTSKLSFAPGHNGLSWSLTGLDIDMAADWTVKWKNGWFVIATDGSVDLKLDSASIAVTIGVGQAGGRPKVSVAKCKMSVKDVDIKFHGSTASLLNKFKGPLGDKLKDLMETKVCSVLKDVAESKANDQLKKLKVNVGVDRFLLDYSLVQTPSIRSSSLETHHKGEVFWKNDVKEAPFTPKPIPPLADQSRMLYLWVTEYIPKSALTTAQSHKYLAYNITRQDFTGVYQNYLNATCKDTCIGKLIKQIGIQFPYSQIMVSVSASETPSLKIAPSGITATVKANLNLFAIRPDDLTSHNLIEISAEVSATIVGAVVKERLTGKITSQSIKFSVTKSPIGTVDPKNLNAALNGILDYGAVPFGNFVLQAGIDLPLTGVIAFKNTQIKLLDGIAVIATDLYYK